MGILPHTLLTDSKSYSCVQYWDSSQDHRGNSCACCPLTLLGLSEGRWDCLHEAFSSREEYFYSVSSFLFFFFIHSTNIYWDPLCTLKLGTHLLPIGHEQAPCPKLCPLPQQTCRTLIAGCMAFLDLLPTHRAQPPCPSPTLLRPHWPPCPAGASRQTPAGTAQTAPWQWRCASGNGSRTEQRAVYEPHCLSSNPSPTASSSVTTGS